MAASIEGGRQCKPVGQEALLRREPPAACQGGRGHSQTGSNGTKRSRQLRYAILLFILGAAWGLQFTLLKRAADSELDELSILTLAMFLLAFAYLIGLACSRAWFRPSLRHIWFFSVSALFGFIVPLSGVMLVAEELSAGLIVFFESLTPLLTILLVLVAGTG